MQVIVAYMFDSWEGRMTEERRQQTRGPNGGGSLFSILVGHDHDRLQFPGFLIGRGGRRGLPQATSRNCDIIREEGVAA